MSRGEFACVVGPSGAGKTTLLRTLAGLSQPTSGTALFEGTPLRSVPPGIGVVFQDYGRSLYRGRLRVALRERLHLVSPPRPARTRITLA